MLRAVKVSNYTGVPTDKITLSYNERFKRRIVLKADSGLEFLLDLPKAQELKEDDDLILEDGRCIRVKAAIEPLLKVTATDALLLNRIVWHIGNRHLACAIKSDCVIVHQDHVVKEMILRLGGNIEEVNGPFIPEGGAYGSVPMHKHEH